MNSPIPFILKNILTNILPSKSCKKEKLYIPAAFGGGDNKAFLFLKSNMDNYTINRNEAEIK
jgi:hypothetical protein